MQQYARHEGSVLMSGEPGTGRGAFARYMHALSRRADEPLTVLTAASLTGQQPRRTAARQRGRRRDQRRRVRARGRRHAGHRRARGPERQGGPALLLGVLEDRAATRASAARSQSGRGARRRDGCRRLRSEDRVRPAAPRSRRAPQRTELRVPPLREYAEDVPELLTYYVDKLVDSEGLTFRRFSVAAQNRLRNYPWPDNVRELKNLVRRLLMSGSDADISLEEVEAEI